MRFKISKSEVHNEGIKFKFYLGKDCFLNPDLQTQVFPFFQYSHDRNAKIRFDFITTKVFSWLWFRVRLQLESVRSGPVLDISLPERLFMMLPPRINVVGKISKFNFVQEDVIKISYIYNDELLFDEVVSKDLTEALLIAVNKLKETDNVRFMRSEYIKLYENSFNMEGPQERKFEPYYE